jgi:hypothetical protein
MRSPAGAWSHSMQVVHRLVGYDLDTDRMKIQVEVPPGLLAEAKRIAAVGEDDPDAAWSYPLSDEQARKLAALIGTGLESSRTEFFLEAFAT